MPCPPDCPEKPEGVAPTGVLKTNLETIKRETQDWPGGGPPPPPPPRESSGQKIKRETEERNRQWLIEHGEDPDDPIFN